MRTFAIVLSVLLMIIPGRAEEETGFKVYPLGNADVSSAEQVVKTLVEPAGSVFVDKSHHRLLVIATPEGHRKTADAIRQMDVAGVNVRIHVEFIDNTTQSDSQIGLSADGEVVVQNNSGTHASLNLTPTLSHRTTEHSSNTEQILLVMSGHEATLNIGTEVAYPEWFIDYGLRWGIISQEIKWRKVGASLIVKPTVLGAGPMINIKLIPELSGLVDNNPYKVRFTRAATEVIVQNGTTLQLGGMDKDNDFYSRFLIGAGHSRTSGTLDIRLTPDIVTPSGQSLNP